MSSPAESAAVSKRPARIVDLGKMTLGDLVRSYVTYPSIIFYAVLFVACIAGAFALGLANHPGRAALVVALTFLIYPPVEYVLHRYVLHARWLYKSPLTANVWKRIHFDHHQDPQRLDVLFGSPSNTLPAIAVFTLPLGYFVGGGWATALISAATGLLIFSVYEFCHCVQHLNYVPNNAWLREIKKHHMAHHFHNESGNYGITSTIIDRVVGSLYTDPKAKPRSPYVNNLGYDDVEAERYPWVRRSSPPQSGRSER